MGRFTLCLKLIAAALSPRSIPTTAGTQLSIQPEMRSLHPGTGAVSKWEPSIGWSLGLTLKTAGTQEIAITGSRVIAPAGIQLMPNLWCRRPETTRDERGSLYYLIDLRPILHSQHQEDRSQRPRTCEHSYHLASYSDNPHSSLDSIISF